MQFTQATRCLLSVLGVLAFALAVSARDALASEDTDCHPAVDPNRPQYVIGYGSLMETASEERSWHNAGRSLPVRVRGFERSWNARGSDIGFSTTYLGVERKAGAELVAALYRVYDIADFPGGDSREYIYCRVRVDPMQVAMLDGSETPKAGSIWIYLLNEDSRQPPDARFPMIQSYVDIFLSGCIELGKRVVVPDLDFLTECVATTKGWSVHWVNDRIFPRRPVHQPNARRIDALLHRMLPEKFNAIRLE